MRTCLGTCAEVRGQFDSLLSPSILRVPGIKLRSSGLVQAPLLLNQFVNQKGLLWIHISSINLIIPPCMRVPVCYQGVQTLDALVSTSFHLLPLLPSDLIHEFAFPWGKSKVSWGTSVSSWHQRAGRTGYQVGEDVSLATSLRLHFLLEQRLARVWT